MPPGHIPWHPTLFVLLCLFLPVINASSIDVAISTSVLTTSAISGGPSAASTSTPSSMSSIPAQPESTPSTTTIYTISTSSVSEAETAPSTTCTTMPTCTPISSSVLSNLTDPKAIMGFIIVFFLLVLGLLNLYYRWRAHNISDDQMLQCWAEHGTGKLMLANENGITHHLYTGNPADIPAGEFVVRLTATREEMPRVWWSVHYTKKGWLPKALRSHLGVVYTHL